MQPLVVCHIGHFTLRQLALVKLEFGAAQVGRNVVFINLVQIELQAVNFDAGVVGLNVMLFGHGGAVTAATDQGRGVDKGILALRTRKACIGQQNARLIRDTANGQQTRIVIIRNLKTSRHGAAMHQLAIRAHGGDGHLDRRCIQVHIGVNTVRQCQGLTVIHVVCVGVDLYAVGNFFAGVKGTVFVFRNNDPAMFHGGVFFFDVAVGGDGNGVGIIIFLAVTITHSNRVGVTLAATCRAGDAVPFLVGKHGVIGDNILLFVESAICTAPNAMTRNIHWSYYI